MKEIVNMSVRNIYGTNPLAYEIALARGKITQTGRMIHQYLNTQQRPYDVVVLPVGSTYGQMMVDSDPLSPETEKARAEYKKHTGTTVLAGPTVFWCPDYSFTYYGDVKGIGMQQDGTLVPKRNNQLISGDYYYKYPTSFRPVEVPVVRYTKSLMPPWIVLFHELGHTKQYYSNTPANWDIRLQNTDDIEAENLALHEQPICTEATLAIRAHYKHMVNGFEFIASAYREKKKPALRVSEGRQKRIADDQELIQLVAGQNGDTGFFRKL
jgi:hypothetical protein